MTTRVARAAGLVMLGVVMEVYVANSSSEPLGVIRGAESCL